MTGEVLRALTFALGCIVLGWLSGMVRSYWRLLVEDPVTRRQASVPKSMLWFCAGFFLVVSSLMWRAVEFWHSPWSVAQYIGLAGLVCSFFGLVFMHRNVTARQRHREQGSP